MVTLSRSQELQLRRHATARNQTPAETLQEMLSQPIPQKRRWTPEELEAVRNPRNSPGAIAARFGRTPAAVSVKRHQLAQDENRPDLLRRPARRPPQPPPAAERTPA